MSMTRKLSVKILSIILVMVVVFATFPGIGVSADDDPDVKYYKIDNEWVGFNPVTQTLTWYPDSKESIIIPEEFEGVKVI